MGRGREDWNLSMIDQIGNSEKERDLEPQMPPFPENKTMTQVTYPRIVIKCKFTWLRDSPYDPGQVLPLSYPSVKWQS